jgi:hypothetical protein
MKCQFIKENGKQCMANAMVGSNFCFLHNPEISQDNKRQAQIKGGKANIIRINQILDPIEIKQPNDVVILLEDVINRVRSGELDVRVANTLAYVSGQILKALEVSEVNKKVATIERIILERSHKNG